MAKVLAYTIALNERKHVERWATATVDFDYRVVVDTGSTDGTPELLEQLGVTVHRITVDPFRFDMARNAALALLPADADLCLSLDMDETCDADLAEKLRKIGKADKVRIWHNTGNKWRCDRVHSRKGWHWVSPCHEVTMWYSEGQPHVVEIDANIYHKPDKDKPRSGYLPLLELAVREKPTDGRMWTYLAREYMYAGDAEGLEYAAQEAFNKNPWDPERAAAMRWAGELGDREDYLYTAVGTCPTEAENWYALANYYYRNSEWDKCWVATEKGLQCNPTTHYLRDESILAWRLFDLLAIAHWNRGKPDDALYWGLKALANNPDDERLQQNVTFYRGKID